MLKNILRVSSASVLLLGLSAGAETFESQEDSNGGDADIQQCVFEVVQPMGRFCTNLTQDANECEQRIINLQTYCHQEAESLKSECKNRVQNFLYCEGQTEEDEGQQKCKDIKKALEEYQKELVGALREYCEDMEEALQEYYDEQSSLQDNSQNWLYTTATTKDDGTCVSIIEDIGTIQGNKGLIVHVEC